MAVFGEAHFRTPGCLLVTGQRGQAARLPSEETGLARGTLSTGADQ